MSHHNDQSARSDRRAASPVPAAIRMGGSIWYIDGHRPHLFSDTRPVLEQILAYTPAAIDKLFAHGVVE